MVGLLAAAGFWQFATPFVDALAYKHSENWVFHVSFEGSVSMLLIFFNSDVDDINHSFVLCTSVRWGVPVVTAILYVCAVLYYLFVRLPSIKKKKATQQQLTEAQVNKQAKYDATVNKWLARWNMMLSTLSFVMLVVR